jgi:redox-sensitive bicupin YhaK (pirin superfamily)
MHENERRIVRLVGGMDVHDGAGVKLNRVIGQPVLRNLDPFLLFDEFRSDDNQDYLGGFPAHPHRGFETVTYMLAGRMRHGDSKGNSGDLGPGSVQWMTAGRGIVHSEMPQQEEGLMWGFQLWVNLPAAQKMCEPRYQDISPERIPSVSPSPGVTVKIIAGTFGGVTGVVSDVPTSPVYLDVQLVFGRSADIPLPVCHTAFIYMIDGADAVVGNQAMRRGELAVLSAGEVVRVSAGSNGCRLLVIAAAPLQEPIVQHGPFVMNTAAEIEQAVHDFRSGRF